MSEAREQRRDPLLEEANRRAHRLARAACALEVVGKDTYLYPQGVTAVRAYVISSKTWDELERYRDAYEEIEQRQIEEATR